MSSFVPTARAAELGRDFGGAALRAREALDREGVIRAQPTKAQLQAAAAKADGEVRNILTRTGVRPEHVTWLADNLEKIAMQTLKRENVSVKRVGPDFVVERASIIAFAKGCGRFVQSNARRRVEVDPALVAPPGVSARVKRTPRAMTVSPARAHTKRTAGRVVTETPVPEPPVVVAPQRETPVKAVEIDEVLRAQVAAEEARRRAMDVAPGHQFAFFE